ncbi:MAG: hypothetical protein JNM41_01405 [Flavipsychrobacter sp.]|nr:hypothetical protein [Flavipsychrobacter sp.]
MHTFHIPVLGLSYSVDTPLKVARYGISSVVSIIEDEMVEKMRGFHATRNGIPYTYISDKEPDYRARRITGYLNLMKQLIDAQMIEMRSYDIDSLNPLTTYFEMLPQDSTLREAYERVKKMPEGEQRQKLIAELKECVVPGSIDVNIMAKVDNLTYAADGTPLPAEFSDASAALRGFALSELNSALVLSAGYNPRLYNYLEAFPDFFPDEYGNLKKKIILKVSDFRSATIQGKLLAKKGVWVSEFRIESGLNCGGHAFATDGFLLGPILEDFKQKRDDLRAELLEICNAANARKERHMLPATLVQRITVQGGIGTANEDEFLRAYYQLDGTGWGSPFLLVPEATNVDNETLHAMATASPSDYFLSNASPLGVPFHNFRRTTATQQIKDRLQKGRPGSPCYKKYLSSDTEFTTAPICTASREYQHKKIAQLESMDLPPEEYATALARITEKDCLCEGLTSSVFLKEDISLSHGLSAVTICPGPNLQFFSGVFTLREMVDHIYGRTNLLNNLYRPNMFINELGLYVDHLKKEVAKGARDFNKKHLDFVTNFRNNLLDGINYYKDLVPELKKETTTYIQRMKDELAHYQELLTSLPLVPVQAVAVPQPV